MKYEELSEELRSALESSRFAAVRYSSAVGEPADKVDDAILFSVGSDADIGAMEGYVKTVPSVWFEFVSEGKSDEEAVKMAEESLGIFEEAAPVE